MVQAKISYKIDVLGTLANMDRNTELILNITGKNRDCSYSAVQSSKRKVEETGKLIDVSLINEGTQVRIIRKY